MTDVPADTPELEPAATFDSARLIADVRRGDAQAIGEAYRVTFGTALGRLVLLHALATLGRVGQARGPESLEQANHSNGRGSAVLDIAGLAGFDPVAIAAAGLTQTLEGARHERGYRYDHDRNDGHHDAGPQILFGDELFDGGASDDGGGLDGFGPEDG